MLKRTMISAVLAAGLLGSPAFSAATQDRIVEELAAQGFTRIEIGRTLLGRTRVLAYSPDYRREIVFNPATGVILRDFWVTINGGKGSPSGIVNPSGGSKRNDSDDDDDDDDNDDDDDDGSDSDDDDDDESSGSGSSDDSGDDDDDDD